jgi:hypothetical protein
MKRCDFSMLVLLIIKTFNGADISSNDGNLRSGVNEWSSRGQERNYKRLLVCVCFPIDRICWHGMVFSLFFSFLFFSRFYNWFFQLLMTIGTYNERQRERRRESWMVSEINSPKPIFKVLKT